MAGFLRLYYNKRGPLPWSVDEGSQATERNFAQVFCDAAFITCCSIEGVTDPTLQPAGWLEFPHAVLTVIDDKAFVTEAEKT